MHYAIVILAVVGVILLESLWVAFRTRKKTDTYTITGDIMLVGTKKFQDLPFFHASAGSDNVNFS